MLNWFRKHGFGQHHRQQPVGKSRLSSSAPDLTEDEEENSGIVLEKICNHGFPISPSCMEYDETHKLLIIGTSTGEIRVLGRPGVELSGFHDEVARVLHILPVVDEPAFVTVCSGNQLYRWRYFSAEEGSSSLVLEKTYKLTGGPPKTITAACLPPQSDSIFLGTMGGTTYPVDVQLCGMSPEIISPSRARSRLDYRGNDDPGAVQCLALNPTNKRQLLIGHDANYFELWDAFATKPLGIIKGPEDLSPLVSMCWHSSGLRFVSGHKDGTVTQWRVDTEEEEEEQSHLIVRKKYFDTEDCRDIRHIQWPSDSMVVFSGGVPIESLDSDSVTVTDSDDDTVTLLVTSSVRMMCIVEDQVTDMDSGMMDAGSDNESSVSVRKVLILLLEQEVLFVALQLPELPLLLQPYLHSMHNSPVKCQAVYSDVRTDIWQLIDKAGSLQNSVTHPARIKKWPIDGGNVETYATRSRRDLLVTGHEDGTVKFWDISHIYQRLLYTLHTSSYFQLEQDRPESAVRSLPNSRNVGFWDPRGDDERLMVTSICLDGWSLVVGFHGGQALVFKLNNQRAKRAITPIRVTLFRDYMSLNPSLWSNPLPAKEEEVECEPGFQPSHCFQLLPASSVTTLAIASEIKLVAVGSYYGFAVVDLIQNVCDLVHCTYDPDQVELTSTRLQSVRKSFRQSMRRFSLRRSLRGGQSVRTTLRPQQLQRGLSSRGGSLPATARLNTMAPTKRDSVRVMTFTTPLHIHGPYPTPTFWVGTGLGSVYGYYIELPSAVDRDLKPVGVLPVEKDYGKKKQFATLYVGVLDGHVMMEEVTSQLVSRHPSRPDSRLDHHRLHLPHGQHLVVCSEEEIRVLALSSAKKKYKVKLKLNEEDGYHMVSAHYIRMGDQPTLMVMDTQGYIHVFSLPELKPLYKAWCLDGADAVGQRSFVSAPSGLILHLRSPSEFARLAITAEAKSGLKFSSLTRALLLQASGLRKNVPLDHGEGPASDEKERAL